MLRCAILDDYQGTALSRADFGRLKDRVRFNVFREHIPETDALLAALAPYDIVVAMRERTPLDAARLDRLPALRLLVTTGMRNSSIDIAHAKARGIVVSGTEGFAGSTAELAWGLLLSAMRHIPQEVADFRAGAPWQQRVGRDLRGMRLGLLGLGALGTRMARYANAFEMSVAAWSRNNTPDRSAAAGAYFEPDLDRLLAESDAVSIHLLLTPETRGLIGARELGLMKPDAVLVNTSRGPIVDEAALLRSLREGRLGAAAVDVYDREPLPLDHPFRSEPRLIATPHIGYVTARTFERFFSGVVEDIEAWLAGSPVRTL